MKPLHVSTATAAGGRNGRVRSDDGAIDLATSLEVTAQVTIGRDEAGLGLEVEPRVRIGQVSEDQARVLVEAAHFVCPYSRATRGNVPVTLTVLT